MRADRTAGTIVARATADGRGAIAIVRLSGPEASTILDRIFRPKRLVPQKRPRSMVGGWVMNHAGTRLDQVLAVFMPAPHSYTGEDVVELHCHGGMAVTRAILHTAVEAGARLALPGEFTQRAFEAGKLDLIQAEAVLRIIEAETQADLRGAARLLEGELGDRLRRIKDTLVTLQAELEAAIEFPDEPDVKQILGACVPELVSEIQALVKMVKRLPESKPMVVLAGRPNVGKSSLANALAGRELSIITSEAGTTRDAVEAVVLVGGHAVTLVDTAGLGGSKSTSQAAQKAEEVARQRVARADLVVWVTDESDTAGVGPETNAPVLWVRNKADLLPRGERGKLRKKVEQQGGSFISAKTGHGINQLLLVIDRKIGEMLGPADGLPVSVRQLESLGSIQNAVAQADRVLQSGQPELAVVDVKEALVQVGQLLGEAVEGEVLDRIFETFCIGK